MMKAVQNDFDSPVGVEQCPGPYSRKLKRKPSAFIEARCFRNALRIHADEWRTIPVTVRADQKVHLKG
jgi:hypothetical protein